MIGEIADTNFVLHSEWSDGLPSAFNFRLADIDNDGVCEALLYDGSAWESYFYRNGHWDLYTDILPPVTANDISFADANGDGNLDLFTSNEVWLNLNPSSSDRDFIPHPSSYILSAFPNPFNPVTQLSFDLPHAGKVTLQVFDLVGREVVKLADGWKEAGINRITWNAKTQPSGLYFARLTAPGGIRTIKLCLTK